MSKSKLAQGALEGDYKNQYRKRIKNELKRPGQGVDALLKRMYAKVPTNRNGKMKGPNNVA